MKWVPAILVFLFSPKTPFDRGLNVRHSQIIEKHRKKDNGINYLIPIIIRQKSADLGDDLITGNNRDRYHCQIAKHGENNVNTGSDKNGNNTIGHDTTQKTNDFVENFAKHHLTPFLNEQNWLTCAKLYNNIRKLSIFAGD